MIVLYSIVAIASLLILYMPLKYATGKEKGSSPAVLLPMICVFIMYAFPIIGALTGDGPVCWFFQKWGNIFLGYLLYFFGILLIFLIVLLIIKTGRKGRNIEKRHPSKAFWSIVLTVLLIFTVAINVGGSFVSHDVQVTNYELSKDMLGLDKPARVILIGDLHIGVNSGTQLYEDMVDRVNEQDADIVLIAGDLVTSSFGAMRDPEKYASIFRNIKTKYGVYAVYGNHDVDEPLLGGFTYVDKKDAKRNPNMESWVSSCGWTMLEDELTEIPGLEGMILAGRRDEAKPGDGIDERMTLSELLRNADPAKKVLLLQHEPTDLDILGDEGVALSLSGHTHDGQIFPGNIFCRIKGPQSYGYKEWGDASAIVTSGVGYYGPPIRVATISEIVVIDFK